MRFALRSSAVLALLAAATPLAAQSDAPSSSARSGGFGVMQVVASDEARFQREWAVTTPGADLTVSTRTVANKPLFVHILFFGCKPNAAGDCDVTGEVAFYGPDGKLEQEKKDLVIWRQKAPDSPTNIYLGGPAVGFGTDDAGPFGAHRVVYKVTDNVAGITLVTEQTLTIAPAK
jgi:hypothetical protein